MVDIAWLAATAVGRFLVPLFARGEDQFVADLGGSCGDAAAHGLVKTAKTIWKRIGSRFDRDDEKNAVGLFEKNPAAMEQMLVKLLEKRLADDADFRRDIQRLVAEPVADTGQSSWQLIGEYVGAVDIRNTTINNSEVVGLRVDHGGSANLSPAEERHQS